MRSVTSYGVSPHLAGRGSIHYIFRAFSVRRPRFVRNYCHFCTKYELICSFNTFCTCIHPYYVQKTYKTMYEFHFQLGLSRRVRSVTSHGVSPHLAGRGIDHYIFRAFSEVPPAWGAFIMYFGRSPSRRPCFVLDLLSFLY